MQTQRPALSFKFETPPHLMIVEARYYDDIADLQLQGVKQALDATHATYEILPVPGALEIPAAIHYAVKSLDFDPNRRRCDGYIALGCVLKGGTQHDEIVGDLSAKGLQELALRYTLAISNGILTCDTKEQALERADPAKLNRAGEAANAALRMIEIKQQYRLTAKRRWVAKG